MQYLLKSLKKEIVQFYLILLILYHPTTGVDSPDFASSD